MKRKNSGGGAEHLYTDVKRDLTPEQLAAVGAVTLAWNGLEGCIDAIFVVATETPAELAMDVVTRINGFDGKTAVIKKWLGNISEFPENVRKDFELAIDSATECKTNRDAVIHAHVAKKDVGHGHAKRGATYSVVLSQKALDGLYDRIAATTSELVSVLWIIVMQKIMPKLPTVESRESIAAASAICAAQFRNFQRTRQNLPPLPACPDEPPVRIELGDALYQTLFRLLGVTSPPPIRSQQMKEAIAQVNEAGRKVKAKTAITGTPQPQDALPSQAPSEQIKAPEHLASAAPDPSDAPAK